MFTTTNNNNYSDSVGATQSYKLEGCGFADQHRWAHTLCLVHYTMIRAGCRQWSAGVKSDFQHFDGIFIMTKYMQLIFHFQVSVPMYHTTNQQSIPTSSNTISWFCVDKNKMHPSLSCRLTQYRRDNLTMSIKLFVVSWHLILVQFPCF